MDFVIVFFRDVLSGPVYIVVVSICSILICSCIGYMGERYLEEKKRIQEQKDTHTDGSQATTRSQVEAAKALKESLAPKEQATEPVQAIAEMPVEPAEETEEAASADPNAGVNYNVANIGSDDLLEDD